TLSSQQPFMHHPDLEIDLERWIDLESEENERIQEFPRPTARLLIVEPNEAYSVDVVHVNGSKRMHHATQQIL
ncbi:hypothetical protein PFISCL1PPCAC_2294, partial [Pristionchus fissidentatus]